VDVDSTVFAGLAGNSANLASRIDFADIPDQVDGGQQPKTHLSKRRRRFFARLPRSSEGSCSMYHQHWGLQYWPFASGLDATRFFRSPTHDEALARLHFLVDENRRLGLLLGPAGSGKSLTLEVFERDIARTGAEIVRLNLLGMGDHEFLHQLALAMKLPCERTLAQYQLWRLVGDHLTENRYQKQQTLLVFDDADEASRDVLEQIARLSQLEPTSDARLTFVLAAANHRLNRLGSRLLSMSELRIDLQPFELDDTVQYVNAALSQAGRTTAAFHDDALSRLHELSFGNVRRVNQLADLALLAAASQGLRRVDVDTIEGVCRELGIDESLMRH
jgi:type II secretory pathway predicted ATPase ExeA